MAKIPMRVIPKPPEHTRHISTAQGPGSKVYGGGGDGDFTFVCGNCRDILWENAAPDRVMMSTEDDEGNFIDTFRVRDIVVRCKGCGSYNEIP